MASAAIVVAEFTETVVAADGRAFTAQACGRAREDGLWEGWLEFTPVGGGEPLRTRRETTQPGLDDLRYWAGGLGDVYLAGALVRATTPASRREAPVPMRPAFDGPAPDVADVSAEPRPRAILDPFAVYAQGEEILRAELGALDEGHLVDIVRAHGLSDEPPSSLDRLGAATLAHLIVDGVRAAVAQAARSDAPGGREGMPRGERRG